MIAKESLRIGQLLVDEGVITPEQLEGLLKEQGVGQEFICTTLVKQGLASEEKAFGALSRRLGIPYCQIRTRSIASSVVQKVPVRFASHYTVMPLEFDGAALVVAMANPLDIRTLDDLSLLLGCPVKGVFASETDIREAIRVYYGVGAETLERIADQTPLVQEVSLQQEEAQDLDKMAEDASIVKFVNQILGEAIKDRATDVHLEPFQDELRIRFRIDGVLYPITTPAGIRHFHLAVVSRIKVMAHVNIAEHRLPQDGRIKIQVGPEELDVRVSVLPTTFGEAVHIRLLNPRSFLELERLGLLPADLSIIESVIHKAHGVIFVTGPTGSGKTTTLYAALARINSPSTKIITIEDPIEYQLKGVTQLQVIPRIGFDFSAGLRHMLRHDPDVMMVGEVRDYETAEIATRAALTGHLVFSTLHTNDAAGAVTRLLDMGIEPFLVSSSLECLIAQRLVRVICPQCKAAQDPSIEIPGKIRELLAGYPAAVLCEGKGCQACRFTGYLGRTGIYEVLQVTPAIREMVLDRASSHQIKQKAIQQGMRTLRDDGLQKVAQGITTLSEVTRVTQQEELPEE